MTPLVAIINNATDVSFDDLVKVTKALRHQVNEHLGPVWKCGARLSAHKQGDRLPTGCWKLVLADYSGEPGALGFHDDEEGVPPAGIVGVKTALEDGASWSSVLSHELCEMLVDPWASLAAQVGDKMISLEVCDATEGQPYKIDGVEVENFVYPSWFSAEERGPYDFLGLLKAPLTLLDGGYMQSTKISGWHQTNASRVRAAKITAGPGSRRARRRGDQ